ncbi:MAG: hypothetical protein QOE28_1064, partial [Solirubrobacteraceae bacterium]|nr:hypothetical protein [Solirubrobacteraceae bacterium]
VVWPTDSSVRAAFRHCNPAITQDTSLGSYVELSPEGDVIAVQGIVDTP